MVDDIGLIDEGIRGALRGLFTFSIRGLTFREEKGSRKVAIRRVRRIPGMFPCLERIRKVVGR